MDKIEKKKEPEFNEDRLLARMKEHYDIGKRYYARVHKKMRLLNSTDQGDLWRALRAKFPPYQLLPDTNFVSYVKTNILASLYTVTKSAEIVPTSEHDQEICTYLNIALEHEWDKNTVGYYQFLAGDRAALLNYGLTQAFWEEGKKQVAYKNVDPMRFMRDPFADSLDDAGWCMTYNSYHKSMFTKHPLYKKPFKEKVLSKSVSSSTEMLPDYNEKHNINGSQEHYNLFIIWERQGDGTINEIHTIDNEILLCFKKDIRPSIFPFAELFCNLPGSSLIGTSEPAKIFSNNLVYNLMDSIAYTAEYKNQRPPKFVSSQSGLNLAAFTKHGNEADRTFIVNGDASRAVHYHQFPQVSNALPNLQSMLSNNMQLVSGVDGRYTGRDTGSIITTGGTEEMLNRVTLIDTPKVMNYEAYTKRLTQLTLRLLLEFAPKRAYLVKNDSKSTDKNLVYDTVEVDFPQIDADTVFEYTIQISSELPKNKQRVQAWANNMMEKQMQYQQAGLGVDVITPEEWIKFQDVPYKEQLLHRMGMQSRVNAYIEAETAISEYAAMLEQGVLPEDAMEMTAQGLENLRAGEPTPFQQAMPEMGQASGQMSQMPLM